MVSIWKIYYMGDCDDDEDDEAYLLKMRMRMC